MEHEQVRRQQMVRCRLDPGQVLRLVDEVDAVGPGPDAPVCDHLEQVEREHPQRHRPERDQDRELEPVESPAEGRDAASGRSLGANGRGAGYSGDVKFCAHERSTLTGR